MAIEVTSYVEIEDIVEAIRNAPEIDVKHFILELDQAEADEGFTLDILKKLTQSLLEGYEADEEYYATKSLNRLEDGDDFNIKRWKECSSQVELAKTILASIDQFSNCPEGEYLPTSSL